MVVFLSVVGELVTHRALSPVWRDVKGARRSNFAPLEALPPAKERLLCERKTFTERLALRFAPAVISLLAVMRRMRACLALKPPFSTSTKAQTDSGVNKKIVQMHNFS
jgi:hypothetical protein